MKKTKYSKEELDLIQKWGRPNDKNLSSGNFLSVISGKPLSELDMARIRKETSMKMDNLIKTK